jgi:hypothetical protein
MKLAVGILIAMTLLASEFRAGAQTYFVRGKISLIDSPILQKVSKQPGMENIMTGYGHEFGISVSGCRWFMTTYREESLKNGKYVANQSGYDGTNVYHYPYRTVAAKSLFSSQALTQPKRNPRLAQTLRIGKGQTPYHDTTLGQLVWLAWGSSCYFDSVATNRLKPFWDAMHPQIGFTDVTVPAFWRRGANAPQLPAFIQFVSPKRKYVIEPDQRNQVTYQDYHSNYKPFTNAFLRVIASTNLASGLELPLQVEFDIFTQPTVRWGTFRFDAHTIQDRTATASFRPSVGESVQIGDLRFMDAKPRPPTGEIYYKNTNWVETNDVIVQKSYQQAFARNVPEVLERESAGRTRTAQFLLLGVGILGLLLIIWVGFLRGRR